MKKVILYLFPILLLLSCEDLLNKSESSKYGSLKLSFNKPSEELIQSLNNENNRSQSQFVDVDAVRISINGGSPATVSIINGSASYSKTNIDVGTASIKVDLIGGGITKYTQTKSVTIIADQTTSTSFNAFAITNQTINLTSSTQSTYDGGDIINLTWTNSHAEQAVNIERWDQVGGVWVKTKTIENDFVGTSFSWNTQGESSGESVKIRIQSTISNSFVDSQPFQLFSSELIIIYDDARFHDIIELQDGSILAAGRVSNGSGGYDGLLLKIDLEGNILAESSLSIAGDGFQHVVESNNGNIYAISNWTGNNTPAQDMHKFTQNLNYITSSGTNGTATGIASYTSNGTNYLAVSMYYQSDSFGINPSILSYDVSGDNFTLISNWGWHNTEGDEYSIDVDNLNNDNILIISKYFPNGNSNGEYFNYYGWSNFNPSSGGTYWNSNGATTTSLSSSLLTDGYAPAMNAAYWGGSGGGGFAFAALRTHAVNSAMNEFDFENDTWAMDAIYNGADSDGSEHYIIAGDYFINGRFIAALYFYSYNDELNQISYPEYLSDKSSNFCSLSKIQGSYVAAGYLTTENKGIIYISDASSKSTKSVIEVSKTSITSKPEIKYYDVQKFNIK